MSEGIKIPTITAFRSFVRYSKCTPGLKIFHNRRTACEPGNLFV